ncbi:hypothetical protein BX285_7318 [Streptomyces sp. 1114.5]|uniref:hypothetical protein n=1 Tax=unclassified Streptomyces TaxID=2593676 RepID=UPI000BD64238|nr:MULTISPECIES: hypothetical protein [unclassified Streptomyces]RKT08946.1 hypothetical protein BX285_7318 [Streptomyces sp. 1114.5]SOB79369.1 hypothetical protein SAMN06272789_0396 [Streptomyces sp. 1331.2]
MRKHSAHPGGTRYRPGQQRLPVATSDPAALPTALPRGTVRAAPLRLDRPL